MRMVKWFLILVVMVSPLAWAETALDKSKMEKYFALAPKLEALSQKYPDLAALEDEVFIFEDQGRTFTQRLAKSDAYGELNSLAKTHGFESVDEFVDVSVRLFAALYAVQIQELSEEDMPSIDEQRRQLREQADQLKSFGMTDEMIEQTLGSFYAMIEQQEQIARAAAKVSEQDKKAVQEHSEWIMDQLEVLAEMEEQLEREQELQLERQNQPAPAPKQE